MNYELSLPRTSVLVLTHCSSHKTIRSSLTRTWTPAPPLSVVLALRPPKGAAPVSLRIILACGCHCLFDPAEGFRLLEGGEVLDLLQPILSRYSFSLSSRPIAGSRACSFNRSSVGSGGCCFHVVVTRTPAGTAATDQAPLWES